MKFEQQLYYWTHMLDEACGSKTSTQKPINEAWMTDGNVTRWINADDVYDAKKDGFTFTSRPSSYDRNSQFSQRTDGPHRMQPREYYSFLDDLKRGQVTFKYQKKDGTIRTAKGTLNSDVVEGVPQSRYGFISYWDLDAHGWRMFNANSFISKDSVEELTISIPSVNYDEIFSQTQSIKPNQPYRLQSDSNIKWLIENNSFTEVNTRDNDVGISFGWGCPTTRHDQTFPDAEYDLNVYWSTKYKQWYVTAYESFEGRNHRVWGNFGGVSLGNEYVSQMSKSWNLLKAFLENYIKGTNKLPEEEKPNIISKLWSTKAFKESYDSAYD